MAKKSSFKMTFKILQILQTVYLNLNKFILFSNYLIKFYLMILIFFFFSRIIIIRKIPKRKKNLKGEITKGPGYHNTGVV